MTTKITVYLTRPRAGATVCYASGLMRNENGKVFMNKITSAFLFLIANRCEQSSLRRRVVLFYAGVENMTIFESQIAINHNKL